MTSHGTVSRYNTGCRCGLCTRANSSRATTNRKLRLARRIEIDGRLTAPLPPERHGVWSTYTNHGCRCEACTVENSTRT